MLFDRVRWRLLAWTMLVLALILLLVGTTVYLSQQRSLTAQVDRDLALQARDVAEQLSHFGISHIEPGGYRGGTFYLLAAPDGRVLQDPQNVGLSTIPQVAALDTTASYDTLTLATVPARVYMLPLSGPRGSRAVLVVGESLLPEEQSLRSLILVLAGSGLVGLLLSLGGAWFLVGRSLAPIQRAFTRQQEFAADAAHELRTPLTVLRAATDVLDRHRDQPLAANALLFDDARQEIAQLERLVGDLLTLARSDLGELSLAVGEVDLSVLAAQMVRRVAPLAQEHGSVVRAASATGSLLVVADPDRLQQVLLILLDNAIKYSPAGSQVRVRVTAESGAATVEVIPETAKLNINQAAAPELTHLLVALGVGGDQAQGIVQGILDWRSASPGGAFTQFDQHYLGLTPSFRARHASSHGAPSHRPCRADAVKRNGDMGMKENGETTLSGETESPFSIVIL